MDNIHDETIIGEKETENIENITEETVESAETENAVDEDKFEEENFSDNFDHAVIDTPEVDMDAPDIDLDIPDMTLDVPEVDMSSDSDFLDSDIFGDLSTDKSTEEVSLSEKDEDLTLPDSHEAVVEEKSEETVVDEISAEVPSDGGEDFEVGNVEEVEGEEAAVIANEDKAIPEEDLEAYRELKAGNDDSEMVDLSDFKAQSRGKEEKEAAKKKKSKKPAFDLFAHRTKIKSVNARIAAAEPLLYFYNAVVDKRGKIMFINVYQVLQDRFMGKIVPHQYTAIAEGSGRIEDLNTICVQEVVKQCNQYPEYKFAIQISSRFFTKPNVLEKLVSQAKTENNNLIFAFDAVSLQNIGIAAKTGLAMLKNRGISILLDNSELISMSILTDLDYDYIRVDSRYYEKPSEKTYSYLQFFVKFAHEIGVTTCATFCDEDKIADYMLENGIDGIQGCAVSNPIRTVPNALKAITLLDSMINYHEEELDFYNQQEQALMAEVGATSGRR